MSQTHYRGYFFKGGGGWLRLLLETIQTTR